MNKNLSPELTKKILDFAYKAYQENSTANKYRQKGRTPFITHPVFAASLFLADQRVPWTERRIGYQVLILHDILEDTSLDLPDWVTDEVVAGVKELTFDQDLKLKEVFEIIKDKDDFPKLLILCDKLSNLYEEHISLEPGRRELWKGIVAWLAKELEEVYGDTRVIQLANCMVDKTDW